MVTRVPLESNKNSIIAALERYIYVHHLENDPAWIACHRRLLATSDGIHFDAELTTVLNWLITRAQCESPFQAAAVVVAAIYTRSRISPS